MNILEVIKKETADKLQNTALVHIEERVTYAQLFDRVDIMADKLSEEGIEQYSRVAFLSDDNVEYVVTSLAVLKLGAVIVPVSASLSHDELDDVIERIDVDFIINKTQVIKRNALSASDDFKKLNPAFIRFSSGTTGASKGVLLSHESIIERTDAANKGLYVTEDDNVIWVLSMSYHFVVTILLFLRKAATIVLCSDDFPNALVDSMKKEKATFIYASPFHYNVMVASDDFKDSMFARVRMAVSTAVALPIKTAEQFKEKFEITLSQAYGIIEVGLPFINPDTTGRCETSVGRMLSDYQIRIDDQDDKGVGEVLLKGPGMFDAYYSPWVLRNDALDNGWFDTGDIGYIDEEGYLFLVGRSKNVINFTGMKIFPYEVEEVIDAYTGVKESLVYGEEHDIYGHIPVAKIVVEDQENFDMQSFKEHCHMDLAAYKVPKTFEIVKELPHTQSGKLKRNA